MKNFRLALGAALAAFLACPVALAQGGYPNKTITFVVPYAAGGFGDIRARQVTERLSKSLGVSVVVENKAGAGGVVGTNAVAKAAPDGYTIGMGNLAPLAVNRALMKKLPYDPDTDVVPVILLEKAPLVLSTHRSQGIATVKDVVAKAKSDPGKLTYGSSGVGGAHHLSGAMFAHQAGIELTHVPYKGGAAAATDLVAGHIAMMFEMGYAALPAIKGGKVQPIAVSSTKRLALLPEVPTLAESGLANFESYNWQGVIAPKGTPREIVMRLNQELNAILRQPEMREAILSQASEPVGGTPEEFAAFIKAEAAKWSAVVKSANIQPE
ncbi:MAG: tripartite tricarboxylate transporter substrate binding protein [Betaproteobacteria bacterium]|nr:tripartite tricarboxylate transporter substrate binding protein [Betaproteobacteria bacterium]